MPKINYVPKNFKPATRKIIDEANRIIGIYQQQGYSLTLRQLYYQFVSRDLIRNLQSEYKRLGSIVSDARRAGLIDWNAIEDRTRGLKGFGGWDSPAQIVRAMANGYTRNPWEDQPNYVEVWFEKDALMGVFQQAAYEYRVPFFSCRGYTSDSEVWAAGQRLREKAEDGKRPIVLHFGDHDPSGIDMTRDIESRLLMFGDGELEYSGFEVRRLALNMDQILQYNPPPNPAKDTDSRFEGYRTLFGDESWELDALEPTTLERLVHDEVEELIDPDAWDTTIKQEESERGQLLRVSRNWDQVVRSLEA